MLWFVLCVKAGVTQHVRLVSRRRRRLSPALDQSGLRHRSSLLPLTSPLPNYRKLKAFRTFELSRPPVLMYIQQGIHPSVCLCIQLQRICVVAEPVRWSSRFRDSCRTPARRSCERRDSVISLLFAVCVFFGASSD